MAPRTKHCFLAATALGLMIASARRADAGDLTTYTDLGAFQAATQGLTDVNFNGIAPPAGFVNFVIPSGYTDAGTGTNFSFPDVPGGDINVTSATYYSVNFGGPVFPADFLDASGGIPAGANEVITLPASLTAVGLLFSTFDGMPITFTLSNGDAFTDSSTPTFGKVAFLGFTDTAAFSTLTINDPTSFGPLLLDFKFGAAAVPEPSSLTLFGIAGLALVGYGWRRRTAG